MADIHHWHRQRPVRDGAGNHWALLRALAGGLVAIVLLVALVAGVAGLALYALVLGLTRVVD